MDIIISVKRRRKKDVHVEEAELLMKKNSEEVIEILANLILEK